MAKSFRAVPYVVKRDLNKHCYYIIVNGKLVATIMKKPAGWYALSLYHRTLRDAIIYCAYGTRC